MLPQVQVLAGMYCAASPHDTRQQRAGAWQGLALAPLLRAAAPAGAASGVAVARSFTTLAAQQADDGFVLGGTAFCGAEGLRGVAVRVDDGPALELALTAPSLGFVRWSIGWRPPGAGRWRISAAVVDGGGAEQRMQHVRSLFAPPGHGSLIVEVA